MVGHGCRCQQRDHAAVGVADEVGAAPDPFCDEKGVLVEVDPLDRRIRGEARPLHDLQLELVAERSLAAPRRAPAHHAAVDEHDPRALCAGAPSRLRVWG